MNPVLTGLIATATTLVIVVCLVLLALYRRSRFRRPISKQAVVLVSEVLEDTRPCSPTLPLNPANSSSGDHRITDDTDPDVIPNKYGEGNCTFFLSFLSVSRPTFSFSSVSVPFIFLSIEPFS